MYFNLCYFDNADCTLNFFQNFTSLFIFFACLWSSVPSVFLKDCNIFLYYKDTCYHFLKERNKINFFPIYSSIFLLKNTIMTYNIDMKSLHNLRHHY